MDGRGVQEASGVALQACFCLPAGMGTLCLEHTLMTHIEDAGSNQGFLCLFLIQWFAPGGEGALHPPQCVGNGSDPF